MSKEGAIRTYDDYLLGNKPRFSLKSPHDLEVARVVKEAGEGDSLDVALAEARKREMNAKSAASKEADALAVIRYAVTSILGWTPQDAMEHITPEIVNKLKLDQVIKYISFPPDVDKKNDFSWVVYKAFPHETKYDMAKQTIRVYNQVLSGEIPQFPRYMFRGEHGTEKLSIMLCTYISRNIPASSLDDLYKSFADSAEGTRILRKAALHNAYKEFYSSPLLYLHDALGSGGDPFLFNYYLYCDIEDSLFGDKTTGKKRKKKSSSGKS